MNLNVNGKNHEVEVDPKTPLLWVVRDLLKLKGTKYGCGRGLCGACSLHVDGQLIRSCSYPVQFAEGKQIVTLEGIGSPDSPHPVQEAWVEEKVPQCGYCQPGFMMAAAHLLKENPNPTEEDIRSKVTNICRCGTHYRIIKAIKRAAEISNQKIVLE